MKSTRDVYITIFRQKHALSTKEGSKLLTMSVVNCAKVFFEKVAKYVLKYSNRVVSVHSSDLLRLIQWRANSTWVGISALDDSSRANRFLSVGVQGTSMLAIFCWLLNWWMWSNWVKVQDDKDRADTLVNLAGGCWEGFERLYFYDILCFSFWDWTL